MTPPSPEFTHRRLRRWLMRLGVVGLVALAMATLWVSNSFLTERFTADTRNRAQLRLALYAGSIMSELNRTAVVPLLLARDPTLIGALSTSDFATTTQRLIGFQKESGTAAMLLLDSDGRAVAATNRNLLGTQHRNLPYFVEALRSNETVFTVTQIETGGYEFNYSRRLTADKRNIGVIVVRADLGALERSWIGTSEAVVVTDSEGRVILTTERGWRGRTLAEALSERPARSAVFSAIEAAADWGPVPPDAYLSGQALLRTDGRIPFRGWRLTSFTAYASVRQQVNTVLALEAMGFALLLSLGLFAASRRARRQTRAFQRESIELRQLNARLQREIAEREKAQNELRVAEQTLVQSSKLAALGEMSASVSHELNQPLAAMKTYIAGAQLLIRRRRTEEAVASFQRIDDLIERMTAITRQLKSYARKGSDDVAPIDLRRSVDAALAIMEPQINRLKTEIVTDLPPEPVIVLADRLRLEQVIINLLRNALDVLKPQDDRRIEILVRRGSAAVLSVRDNGPGIADLDALFEPFYTTKAPGEGVGLGLAISTGIVKDFGGRLTAHNGASGGAVFEVTLPLHAAGGPQKTAAAE